MVMVDASTIWSHFNVVHINAALSKLLALSLSWWLMIRIILKSLVDLIIPKSKNRNFDLNYLSLEIEIEHPVDYVQTQMDSRKVWWCDCKWLHALLGLAHQDLYFRVGLCYFAALVRYEAHRHSNTICVPAGYWLWARSLILTRV